MIKQLLSAMFFTYFLFSFTNHSNAATFPDVSHNKELETAVTQLTKRGIISGFNDGTFRPNEALTREQAAIILSKLLQLNTSGASSFTDVPKSSASYPYISALANKNIISGFPDGTFAPHQKVTREQIAILLTKSLNLPTKNETLPFSDVEKGSFSEQAIQTLYFNGVAAGLTDQEYAPKTAVTRGQLAIFILRAENIKKRGNSQSISFDKLLMKRVISISSNNQIAQIVKSDRQLTVLPVAVGETSVIVKGPSTESTILEDTYSALTIRVTLKNDQLVVDVKQVPLHEVVTYEASYYNYEQIALTFVPTKVEVVDMYGRLLTSSDFYVGRNDTGIEIAIFSPGSFNVTFSNDQQKETMKAQTTIAPFQMTTILEK